MTYDELAATGHIEIRAPRYTSYPPATVFAAAPNTHAYHSALRDLDPKMPVSVYVHIPFCERLCWFCACRTQGVRSLSPVMAYVDTLTQEIALAARQMPRGIKMGRLHFGGGTPTILGPALIYQIMQTIDATFDRASDFEFAVEVDPTLVNAEKIAAFTRHGMTRASIGVQDFDPQVQRAIGREQSFETTRSCTEMLREAGVTSLNIDLVYGLPHQSAETFCETLDATLALEPDRLSLFGYAHVPHMAKRQRLIPEALLPDDRARFALFEQAQSAFANAGFVALGIDHFAKPGDRLVTAAKSGQLRRNFQGYTDDTCADLLGFGASSISRIGGYFQAAPRTADYARAVSAGVSPVAKQHVWTQQDRLNGRIIEMLLCDFRIDLGKLATEFTLPPALHLQLMACQAKFGSAVGLEPTGLRVQPGFHPLVRAVAQFFDAYSTTEAIYSRVS